MKTVIINLNITSIPPKLIFNYEGDRMKEMEIPCPRVNVFQHPILPDHYITQAGNYSYTFNLEDGGRCGVDVFAWGWNTIDITTDLSIDTKIAGWNLDQIQKHIDITEAGTYNISINIS